MNAPRAIPRRWGTAALLLSLAAGSAGQPFELSHGVVANGGGDAGAGAFALSATIGQAEPGPPASGDVFLLHGGFWGGSGNGVGSDRIFANGFD